MVRQGKRLMGKDSKEEKKELRTVPYAWEARPKLPGSVSKKETKNSKENGQGGGVCGWKQTSKDYSK